MILKPKDLSRNELTFKTWRIIWAEEHKREIYMKVVVFWAMTPYSGLVEYRRFGGSCCVHGKPFSTMITTALIMGAEVSFEI
jgi:hypothetical protein